MAIVGNPDFGLDLAHNTAPVESTFRDLLEDAGPDLQLVPLPASEREAKFIAEKAKGAHWSLLQLLGKAATETAVKQIRQPDVLHLATHGYFMKDRRGKEIANLAQYSKRNPALRSMLFFAGAQNTLNGQQPAASDDGILTAFEAALIPLEGTELVVLSACNTGLGKIQNGEGVIGLQRAFRVAGARSLVMTLWEVEDSATEIFMNVFYEGLFAGKTKTAAFRAAQQALKAKFPQPFYWGAFVLVNG
jgi:CHAT domain-containing protein